MAAIVNTFLYSGTLQQVTIPPGTQSIDVYLWGGAGGGGGTRGPGSGNSALSGSAGGNTTVTNSTLSVSMDAKGGIAVNGDGSTTVCLWRTGAVGSQANANAYPI